MTSGHAPTGMLADYAAGALSEGMSLIVASHLTFCPCCRDKLARIEALGGALLCAAPAVPPNPSCLERALALIEAPCEAASGGEPRDPPLPRPLCRLLPPWPDVRWQPVRPGLSASWLDGFSPERVALTRADPGAPAAPHAPAATLLLAGRLRDGAHTLAPGDLALADPPEAAGEAPSLSLVVLPAPA
jgi:putative transcriptional regulator